MTRKFQDLTILLVWIAFALQLLSDGLVVVGAAQARKRVVVRREGQAAYDREITTFTEDGRLAQVEYGLEASLRGSTVGAALIDGTNQCIVVFIEDSSFGKIHRIDDHIWMLTAGLSGDARMIANQCRRACQNHRLRYGEAPTVGQAARMTADFHHQLTRRGGCRPLGCTAILLGVDDGKTPRIFQTDPGGGYETCNCCAAGQSKDILAKELRTFLEETGVETTTTTQWFVKVVTNITNRLLSILETHKRRPSSSSTLSSSQSIDIWTIQPKKGRRGGMLSTCYTGVRAETVDKLLSTPDEI